MKSPQERIQEVARKQREPNDQRVRAKLPELRQQKHGVEMGHVVAFSSELRGPVRGLLQDKEKRGRDLIPSRHSRLDRGARKPSGGSFELLNDFCSFHCARLAQRLGSAFRSLPVLPV